MIWLSILFDAHRKWFGYLFCSILNDIAFFKAIRQLFNGRKHLITVKSCFYIPFINTELIFLVLSKCSSLSISCVQISSETIYLGNIYITFWFFLDLPSCKHTSVLQLLQWLSKKNTDKRSWTVESTVRFFQCPKIAQLEDIPIQMELKIKVREYRWLNLYFITEKSNSYFGIQRLHGKSSK